MFNNNSEEFHVSSTKLDTEREIRAISLPIRFMFSCAAETDSKNNVTFELPFTQIRYL